eukprot:5399973-Pleurochrysis_carterae.AAC.1
MSAHARSRACMVMRLCTSTVDARARLGARAHGRVLNLLGRISQLCISSSLPAPRKHDYAKSPLTRTVHTCRAHQLLSERAKVLDNAVVHDGEATVGRRVRVRVHVGRRACAEDARVG